MISDCPCAGRFNHRDGARRPNKNPKKNNLVGGGGENRPPHLRQRGEASSYDDLSSFPWPGLDKDYGGKKGGIRRDPGRKETFPGSRTQGPNPNNKSGREWLEAFMRGLFRKDRRSREKKKLGIGSRGMMRWVKGTSIL